MVSIEVGFWQLPEDYTVLFKHFNDKHNMSLIEYYKKHHKLLESGVEPQETPGTEDATGDAEDAEVGMEQVWPIT